MASKITSSPVTEELNTQNELERLFMPKNLLEAAIQGNKTDLKKILGLDDNEQDPPPHTKVSVDTFSFQCPAPSDCLRCITDLKKIMVLDNNEQDPAPHTEVSVEDVMPMEPSDCLRSITGMEDTILHILSTNGHEKLVPTICFKDSSLLKACNTRSETPFHLAARFGHKNVILELIRCAELAFGKEELIKLLRQKNFFGETALHEAARHGHGDVVSTLMDEDIGLASLVSSDFVSPMYLATARGSLELVKNMVAKMPKHQITSEFYSGPKNQTVLHAAVYHSPELTKEVLQLYPKQLSKGTDETRNILHLAVSTGNHEIAKVLLDKDQSLAYIKDSDGSFPVHIAVRMGHIRVIFLLLQRCLDSGQLLDGNGKNYLHIAIEDKRTDIIDKLLKDSKHELPISYRKEMFNIMFQTMDNNGNTPLHFAAQLGSFEHVYSLSKHIKIDMSLQNKEGLTAWDVLLIRLRKFATNKRNDNFHEICTQLGEKRLSAAWLQYYSKDHMSETELNRGAKQDDNETELNRGSKQDDNSISTTGSIGPKKSSKSVMTRAQLVGLGSVLIATVTFAAAFTLPGGTNQDTGTPILGRKYFFKAFVLADFSAFFLSFISTMMLIRSSIDENPEKMKRDVEKSLRIFRFATKCMVMALALGTYLVLAPVCNTALIVIVFSFMLIIYDQRVSLYTVEENLFKIKRQIQKQISDGNCHQYLKPKIDYITPYEASIFYTVFVYILIPSFFIFVLALI